MMIKSCELCKSPAHVYCDSDQASLCWTCDSKVHSANFLVARHSRSLLCRVCRSPTPWTASGEKLGPSTVSVCEKCVVDGVFNDEESEGRNDDDVDEDEVDDDDEYDGDEEGETELDVEDEDDGDDDNQVVPLSYPPPPATSSSSDDDSVTDRGVLLKRKRENVSDLSEDDVDCLSVQINHRCDETGDNSNGRTLYRFLSLTSEAMGEKRENHRHRNKISGENNAGGVTGECKETKTVQL
ncbi:hypothetical protein QVD17_18175 [Tagetes erecta]|uniref:B box-type domain-containing protein n=1 Tax=Tagetes erecta TaxID=13708 RepID=A0AAD8KK51_TARER|nr:hypothetical protein QVD17_18175 [Tagetes erecta]